MSKNVKIVRAALSNFRSVVASVRLPVMRLFDQQLWCFGRDICEHGNLLKQYGFEKRTPPSQGCGGSEYALQSEKGCTITLWGYGAHVMRPSEGGVFIRRYTFSPRYTPIGYVPHGQWHLASWKSMRAPQNNEEEASTGRALIVWTECFSAYEAWVSRKAGAAYRAACVERWHKEAAVPGAAMQEEWIKWKRFFERTL
jgi:hypothetical protein